MWERKRGQRRKYGRRLRVEEESIFVQISYSVAPVSKYEFYDGIWCPMLCVYSPSFKN